MITLEALEEMFSRIRGNTDWDADGPMLWGYFFTDRSENKLRSVIPLLEQQGYRYVDMYVPELDGEAAEYFFLHVEQEEVHTPQSLHERNQHLYAFADRYGLDSYDGMDVGPTQS